MDTSKCIVIGSSSPSEPVALLWDFLQSDSGRVNAICECPALAVSIVQLMLSPGSQGWWERRGEATQQQRRGDGPNAFDDVFFASTSRTDALTKITDHGHSSGNCSTSGDAHFCTSLLRGIDYILQDSTRNPLLTAAELSLVRPGLAFDEWLPAPVGRGRRLDDTWVDAAFQACRKRLKDICGMLLDNASHASMAVFAQRAPMILQSLQHAGLLSTQSTQLTGAGMRFCMAEAAEQFCSLLQGAIRTVVSSGATTMDDVLRHIAVLWKADTNRYALPFPTKEHHPVLHSLLVRLIDVGLVYPVASSGERYFVVTAAFGLGCLRRGVSTPLMNSMLADHDASQTRSIRAEDEDSIITETNFRLYAYTRNPTLLRVLEQFTELDTVVDGWLVCCKLTRDAFVGAVRRGITAHQVLDFLALKAHSVMRRRAAETGAADVVPQSIGDQLRMWEADCRRVTLVNDSILLSGLSSKQRARLLATIEAQGYTKAEAVLYDDHAHTLVVRGVVYDEIILPLMTTAVEAPPVKE